MARVCVTCRHSGVFLQMHLAAEGDRLQRPAVAGKEVHARVVVVDHRPQLVDDRLGDLPDVVQPVQLAGQPAEQADLGQRLELGLAPAAANVRLDGLRITSSYPGITLESTGADVRNDLLDFNECAIRVIAGGNTVSAVPPRRD